MGVRRLTAAMKGRLSGVIEGEGLAARAMRSSAWTVFGFGSAQVIRLASNLILTRLLFPEAFGMMALIMVFMQGLANFTDVGINTSIHQNKRGDEPDFLDTAWTIQVIRGVLLWLGCCAIAWPVASFYDTPMLAELLPAAGLTILIGGFNPMSLETANRHLMLGRITLIEMACQILGIAVAIALAWAYESVWALVVSGIVAAIGKLVLAHIALPGRPNRFLWDRTAVRELIRFGKWIFLSTACGFLVAQGDRLILGKYISVETLGVYNIGYFLASFPIYLANTLTWKILIPLFREMPPGGSRESFAKIRLMRVGLTGSIVGALVAMALLGVPLVALLYDSRYADAGAMVAAIACAQMPYVIGMTYNQAALAAGDSRGYALLITVKAAALVGFMLIGAEWGGLLGALAGQGLAAVVCYPLIAWLARRHGAWDPWHDGGFALAGLVFGGLALWTNREALARIAAFGL